MITLTEVFEVVPEKKEYTVHDGVSFDSRTPKEVIAVLNTARIMRTRLKIHYGDVKTGVSWGDSCDVGYIGRSTGLHKVPLAVFNKRSHGGPAILDDCIIQIEYANRKHGGVLYRHPMLKGGRYAR